MYLKLTIFNVGFLTEIQYMIREKGKDLFYSSRENYLVKCEIFIYFSGTLQLHLFN